MSFRPARGFERRLEEFLGEVRRWGQRVNLVGSTTAQALRVHVEDSLAAAPWIPEAALVVDLGSGAGFPGVPLLLARPDLRITLVESRERRAHFLRHVVRTLELDCRVLRTRIECPTGGPFDVALLRAVAPLQRAAELGEPWVLPEGEIWIWTREDRASVGLGVAAEISLGARGRILRLRASEVPRGTRS